MKRKFFLKRFVLYFLAFFIPPAFLFGVAFTIFEKNAEDKLLSQEQKIMEAKEKQEPYFVLESAILLQAGFGDICSEIWYVQVSEQTRRERLKASRGYSDEKIDSILKNQWSDTQFLEKADKRIWNEGELEEVLQQIQEMLM